MVLKLSGEVFGGGAIGVDPDVVQGIARQIATVVRRGVQVSVVVGGGNFFRGAELQKRGMDRARADYMGMLGTVMNCSGPPGLPGEGGHRDPGAERHHDGPGRRAVHPLRAIRHLEKGRVVIFGAGAGMPYFSTDTVAAQRALEIRADVVLMSKNGVDAVYTADPGSTRPRASSTRSPSPRCCAVTCGWPTPPRSASAWRTACRCWSSAPRATTPSSGPSAARRSAP
ncbi:UMP kinase [Micromonospora sp. BRA006-A]|nr:UMP kinase [Micromonospora sp. BRA006-A]